MGNSQGNRRGSLRRQVKGGNRTRSQSEDMPASPVPAILGPSKPTKILKPQSADNTPLIKGQNSTSFPSSNNSPPFGSSPNEKFLKPSRLELDRAERKSAELLIDRDHPYLAVEDIGGRTRQLSLLERQMRETEDSLGDDERRRRAHVMEQREGLKDWQYSILNDLGDLDRVKQYHVFVLKALRQALSRQFEMIGIDRYVPDTERIRIKVEADCPEKFYAIILSFLVPPPRRTNEDLRRSGLLQ